MITCYPTIILRCTTYVFCNGMLSPLQNTYVGMLSLLQNTYVVCLYSMMFIWLHETNPLQEFTLGVKNKSLCLLILVYGPYFGSMDTPLLKQYFSINMLCFSLATLFLIDYMFPNFVLLFLFFFEFCASVRCCRPYRWAAVRCPYLTMHYFSCPAFK